MIALIAAISKNNCIGKNNQLPWSIPEDMKHFKKITKGKTVLMGRKTFESILGYLGKPLPNRTNLVITRDPNYQVPKGAKVCNNLEQAITEHQDIFVIGGANIYEQTISQANKLYITHVDQQVDGDAFFPNIDMNIWEKTDEKNHDGFSFVTYVKK